MKTEEIHYEFINSQTGNVIAYFSLPANITNDERQTRLERKRDELAVANALYKELIFWQDHGHGVKRGDIEQG